MNMFVALLTLLFSFSVYSQSSTNYCDSDFVQENKRLLRSNSNYSQLSAVFMLGHTKTLCPLDFIKNNIDDDQLQRSLTRILSPIEHVISAQIENHELDTELFNKYSFIIQAYNIPVNPFRKKLLDYQKTFSSPEDCTSINLMNNSAPLSILQNQSDSNLCFAFSASDLLSYELNKKVSPLYLAIKGYNYLYSLLNINRDLIRKGGSRVKTAIVNTGELLCLESGEPLTHDFFRSGYDMSLVELSEAINSMSNTRTSSLNENQWIAFNKVRRLFPNLSKSEFNSIISDSHQSLLPHDTFSRILKASCRKSMFPLEKVSVVEIDFENTLSKTKTKNIDDVLLSQKPVAVYLYGGAIYHHPIDHITYSNQYSKAIGRHAVTIVGRRYNNTENVCEYLVKHHSSDKSFWQKSTHQQLAPGITVMKRSDLELSVHEITYIK